MTPNPYRPLEETQENISRAARLYTDHRIAGSKFWAELDYGERVAWVFAASLERRAERAELFAEELYDAAVFAIERVEFVGANVRDDWDGHRLTVRQYGEERREPPVTVVKVTSA